MIVIYLLFWALQPNYPLGSAGENKNTLYEKNLQRYNGSGLATALPRSKEVILQWKRIQ